jgi:ribosomal protein L29
MRAKEIRLMSEKDIQVKLNDLHKELIKHNAQVATGTQVKNPGQISQTKKIIARLNTILNEKKQEVKGKTNE